MSFRAGRAAGIWPPRRSVPGLRVRVGVLAAAGLLTGCSSEAAGPDQAGHPVCASQTGDTAFPTSTAQDWVTYADHVVVLRAVSENRSEASAEELAAGEGVRWRVVTLERETVLWSRAGAPAAAVPTSWKLYGGGWSFRGASEGPLERAEGEAGLELGHRYLAPVTRTTFGGVQRAEWVTLDQLPFDNDTVGDGEPLCFDDGAYPMRAQIWGMSGAEVVGVLEATPADPAAAPYLDRDPAERYQLAQQEAEDTASPTPAPS